MNQALTSYEELARIHKARSDEQLAEIARLKEELEKAYIEVANRAHFESERRKEIERLRYEVNLRTPPIGHASFNPSLVLAERDAEIERLGREMADLNAGWQRTYDHDTNMLKASIAEESRDLAKTEAMLEQEKREHSLCTTFHAIAVKERNHERVLAMEKDAEIAGLRRQVDDAAIHVPAHAAIEIEILRDELADYDNKMLKRFSPQAAESTDLFTWIQCKLAEIERLSEERDDAIEAKQDWIKRYHGQQAEIERLRALISSTAADMASPMFDLWTAVREPEKSGMSIDHALGHLAQSLAPLRREALGHD